MSWHFLERWVEKVNQHSTLVGKFWITFLIICRMVIVASVGDRVYSDEQSEFKCNTLQPGCTNVCFNKFSPISHLRYWSFQIIMVATPSVMYIIYSGHNPKKAKSKARKELKKKQALANRNKKQREIAEDEYNNNNNCNNSNNNTYDVNDQKKNSPSRTSNKSPKNSKTKTSTSDAERNSKSKERQGKSKGQNKDGGSPISNGHRATWPQRSNAPKVLTTLINYKNGETAAPVETSAVDAPDPTSQVKLPWQEMRWNSLVEVAEDTGKKKQTGNDRSTLWKKPKDYSNVGRRRLFDDDKDNRNKPPTLNPELIWVPSSSDDDNRTRKSKRQRVVQSSLTEADMYGSGDGKAFCDKSSPTEKGMELLMQPPLYPPEYPGLEFDRTQWPINQDQMMPDCLRDKEKDTGKRTGRSRISKIEIVRTRTKKPRFTRHFYLYLLSVFARLLLEAFFLVGQVMLYGFEVPDLYKCERWPCPNKVDCFISRPMEKTIFLYFMLIYSCICVLLNGSEVMYLIWVYVFGRPKLVVKQDVVGDSDNQHLEGNRNPKYSSKYYLSDYDRDEYDSEIAYEEDYDALLQNGFARGSYFPRNGQNETKDRSRRYAATKGGAKMRDRLIQERMMRDITEHDDFDIILDAEQDMDDYDLDIAQNDPVDDIIQMEMASGASMGNNDDYA